MRGWVVGLGAAGGDMVGGGEVTMGGLGGGGGGGDGERDCGREAANG